MKSLRIIDIHRAETIEPDSAAAEGSLKTQDKS
jgi:hypothetical protein